MIDYEFQRTSLKELESLRQMQVSDLRAQAHDPLEERIDLAAPACLKIQFAGKDVGYAIIDDKAEVGITLLEFYLVISQRKNAKGVFTELIRSYHCRYWLVNTQDSFALPLMLENGLSYELDGYIFSLDSRKYENSTQADELHARPGLELAKLEDLNQTYTLVMQDGFYTGGGPEALAVRIKNEEIYLLRSEGALIGVGFVSPLVRTPRYADIAMIIDRPYRKKGFASYLVSQLVQVSFQKNLIPTALTSTQNIASRKTLEKCGFYLDGGILLAKII
jgi:GNAT superfamily N-acetyltransferase